MQAGLAQQFPDFWPVHRKRQVFSLAEVEHGKIVIEEIWRIAGQLAKCGMQRHRVGGAKLGLDDLERRALELNRCVLGHACSAG